MTWLSWQVVLRRWRAQMPGLVFVTGTYFVTDMFGRGDLGELMALSAIPFLIAALAAAATARRLTAGHLLAVALGVFVFTGSHNITLLYGTIFLALLAIVVLGAFGRSQLSRLHLRRVPAVFAAAAIGGGLNAWYLLADLKYATNTAVSSHDQYGVRFALNQWRLLLDPLRPSDPSLSGTSHDVRVSLPLLFATWAIAVAVLAWRQVDGVARRLVVLLAGIAALYTYLIVSPAPWRFFPRILYNIQFPLRLHSYVLLATALLVMVVLVSQARANEAVRRATGVVLTVIAVFTVGAATWQAWAVPSTYHTTAGGNRVELSAPSNLANIVTADVYEAPPSWYGAGDFRTLTGTVFADIGFAHTLTVPTNGIRGSKFDGMLDVSLGPRPFRTNISAGPQFVRITGITPVGITQTGFIVAKRTPGTPKTGPVEVTIRPAHTTLLRDGAFISVVSLAALEALVVWRAGALLWPLGAALLPALRRSPIRLSRRATTSP
jgi:hypothetical protein